MAGTGELKLRVQGEAAGGLHEVIGRRQAAGYQLRRSTKVRGSSGRPAGYARPRGAPPQEHRADHAVDDPREPAELALDLPPQLRMRSLTARFDSGRYRSIAHSAAP